MNAESINYTVEDAIRLIEDIGGYDPKTEAEDLYKMAQNDSSLFDEFLERRINHHEPVAYITNHAKFRNLDLYIDKRVLIPRSETEPLVEVAIQELPQKAKVVDVGTGSGAVALATKNERRDLKVVGVDISKDALDVASINSIALKINVDWYAADLLDGVKGEFDCVLANLPYLPTAKKDNYAPEMTEHEPQVALWGGSDGFDLTRRLLAQIQPRKQVKMVALELGLEQEYDVTALIRAAGFPVVFCTTDARGDIRCAVGKR